MKRTIATLSAGLLLAGLLVPTLAVAQNNILIDVPIGHFRDHDYRWVAEPKTWPDAVDYCKDDGGHLVTITSKPENNYVYGFRPGWWEQSWLGASDEAVEGVWRWVTGEPMTYTNWGPDEPNDADASGQGRGEDYMTLGGEGKREFHDWQYETDGSESMLPFTCEYEP
jgi:hypothetical protein